MSRKKHYSYRSPKRSRVRAFFLGVGLIVVILVIASVWIRHIYTENLKPVSSSSSNNLVIIPKGSSLPAISKILKTSGVIRTTWSFEWYVRNDNYARDNIEAGTYYIRPSQSVQEIVTQLTNGQTAKNLVTILPGQRIDQIEAVLIHDGFSENSVETAMNAEQYQTKYPMFQTKPATANLEGFLYPDSFEKDPTTTASTIINESLTEMQAKLTPEIVSGMAAQGLNIYQGVTLASIIEQEVNKPSDLPIVAQVFISRLHSGMNLGSDVTAYYGSIVAGQPPSLTYNSPYNTLINTGLPPGPISNVSQNYLEAVAHPATTNYLYFVTGDNGTTYYATTLQEHNAQTAQYCQQKCSGP